MNSPPTTAPEILLGKGYGKGVDWWSFGSLLFEMLTGLPPFYSQDVQEMYRRIISDPLVFPPIVNDVSKDLISRVYFVFVVFVIVIAVTVIVF